MQARDSVLWQEDKWFLWGWNGAPLFSPGEVGIMPRGWSTACYRGFRCTYRLHDNSLQLQELEVAVDEIPPPLLNGRAPTKYADGDYGPCGDSRYRDVQLPIDFTGGFLLCHQRAERPSSIGPELAWRFEDVRELIFERGKLLKHHDRSAAIAKIRDEVAATNGVIALPEPVAEEDATFARYHLIEAEINACCRFDY